MVLPTRGQSDWDDELNNHINAMEAEVDAAVALATVAASDATYARSFVDDAVAAIDFPVDSVNGATGTVVLSAASVGASATGHNHDSAYIAKGDITAIVALTQAAYDALTPVATTLYVIRA